MSTLLIEVFDEYNAVNNVRQSSLVHANYVVFLHRNPIDYEKQYAIQQFIYDSSASVSDVTFCEVDIYRIETEINRIVSDAYDKIIIDIDGGDSELVVALYRYAMQHQFTVTSIDEDTGKHLMWHDKGIVQRIVNLAPYSIEQMIKLQGGAIKSIKHSTETAIRSGSIRRLMDIILRDTSEWGRVSKVFEKSKYGALNAITPQMLPRGINIKRWINAFEAANLIIRDSGSSGNYRYRYTSREAYDLCRSKGYFLELFLYLLAQESGFFDECYMGVIVDWDGQIEPIDDVFNEIDVVLRKGNRYAFISCKMSQLNPAAINELEVYTSHFIGSNCLKVIACTEEISSSYRNRLEEYGIHLLDKACIQHNFINSMQQLFTQ